MGSKVFAFGDIAGPVQFGKPAVLKKATHPELTERASLYASFSLPVSLMLLCDLPILPRYMSEAVSVAVFTMLAGAACLIGPGNMSPSASSSPSSAL